MYSPVQCHQYGAHYTEALTLYDNDDRRPVVHYL